MVGGPHGFVILAGKWVFLLEEEKFAEVISGREKARLEVERLAKGLLGFLVVELLDVDRAHEIEDERIARVAVFQIHQALERLVVFLGSVVGENPLDRDVLCLLSIRRGELRHRDGGRKQNSG